MYLARKLVLAVTMTLAAMAFLASSASAQSIEVVNEDTGLHCPDAIVEETGHDISGGCVVHGISEVNANTFAHIGGGGELLTSSCETELTAHVGEQGGYIDVDANTIVENESGGCPIEPCDEPATGTTPHADLEWPIGGAVEYGAARETLFATFCIRSHATSEGAGQPCTVGVDVTLEDPVTHQYELRAIEEPCMENPIVELSGHWVGDDEGDLELNHIHYPGENP